MVEVHHATKRCSKCAEVKPYTDFSKGSRYRDRHQSYCKQCASAAGVEWSKKNRERHRANSRAFYVTNLEAERVRIALWREQNRELARQLTKAWERANPDNVAARASLRRSRLLNACPAWASRDEIKSIYTEAARMSRETGALYHVDHIIPLAGKDVCGLHVPWNLRAIPAQENQRKWNKVVTI
jgi:hypothetical protein